MRRLFETAFSKPQDYFSNPDETKFPHSRKTHGPKHNCFGADTF